MNLNKINQFEAQERAADLREEKRGELSEEEILGSNNIDLIAQYAKNNRSAAVIAKVRELLEYSRETGEVVVQNFLHSFIECEEEGKNYLEFENTESGRAALGLIEQLPEPFRAKARSKLENYKKELEYNTELIKKHKDDPEKIWKEIFGFDYYKIPNFKERFKDFLFKDIKAASDDYYKDGGLEVVQDPFAINFFISDEENFDKIYGDEAKHRALGLSKQNGQTHVNVIKTRGREINGIARTAVHETEHSIHEKANVLEAAEMSRPDLTLTTFHEDKIKINSELREYVANNLRRAKDEIFAFLKGGTTKKSAERNLLMKINAPLYKEREDGVLDEIRSSNDLYDYNEELREANYKWIELSKSLTESEKQQLKYGIDFLQSEYERVLQNMAEVIYENEKSIEFLRNVPINELWKYSDGKFSRTDFIIREYKFKTLE